MTIVISFSLRLDTFICSNKRIIQHKGNKQTSFWKCKEDESVNVIFLVCTMYLCINHKVLHFFSLNLLNPTSFFCFLFFNRGDTIQYFGGLRSRELGQAPILLVFLFPRQALSSHHRCLCFAKVFLSHRSQVGNERGLGARQHSLWPNVHSIHLAIWTKASLYYDFCGSPWIFIQINNFFKLLAPGIEPLTLGSQVQRSPPRPRGTPCWLTLFRLLLQYQLHQVNIWFLQHLR